MGGVLLSCMQMAKLLYANPEIDADMLYLGRFKAPDPFLALVTGKEKIAVLSDLEFGRAKKASAFTDIRSLSAMKREAEGVFKERPITLIHVIRLLLKEFKLSAVEIPSEFPAGLAFQLKAARIKVEVAAGMIFPEREFKSDDEADMIREGNAASAAGFGIVEKILKQSKILKNGYLSWGGKRLTSERVIQEIEIGLIEIGARAGTPIVAGGDQACDPHERGHGPLRANELIIVDIFPRVNAHGYHGDMTRTFLKGRASDSQRHLVETVKSAHGLAMNKAKPGVTGGSIHKAIQALFKKAGYVTEKQGDTFVGFFHGTGHGLGLDVHEPPRVGQGTPRLKKGAVVTIEPGLYYPGLGGCRVEDVVRLVPGGCEVLSDYPYEWEIIG